MKNIYCDGACKGNPGESGSGIVVFEDTLPIFGIYGAYTENGTNNIAELKAFKKALLLVENVPTKIYVDSQYTINSITKWSYNWKKNNWTKKGGIKNLELIKEIHEIYDSIKDNLEIIYVKGHSGNEGNDLADNFANAAIKYKQKEWKKELL